MIAALRRARRTEPELVTCDGCGSAFRAAYTDGRCPICDRPASDLPEAAGPLARLRNRMGDRWVTGVLVAAIAANVVIFVFVAVAASR